MEIVSECGIVRDTVIFIYHCVFLKVCISPIFTAHNYILLIKEASLEFLQLCKAPLMLLIVSSICQQRIPSHSYYVTLNVSAFLMGAYWKTHCSSARGFQIKTYQRTAFSFSDLIGWVIIWALMSLVIWCGRLAVR